MDPRCFLATQFKICTAEGPQGQGFFLAQQHEDNFKSNVFASICNFDINKINQNRYISLPVLFKLSKKLGEKKAPLVTRWKVSQCDLWQLPKHMNPIEVVSNHNRSVEV